MRLRDLKESFTLKMSLLVVLCMVAVAVAAPPPSITKSTENSSNVELLKFDNANNGSGNYRFTFEQSDGTKQEQLGEIKNKDSENAYIDVKGSFTWVGPDGVTYTFTYVANEDGYRPIIEQGPGGAIPAGVLASMTG